MSEDEFLKKVEFNTEWLETTEENDVECISIENLKSIIKEHYESS